MSLSVRSWRAGLLTGVILLVGAAPAPAHTDLVASSPAAQAELQQPPAAVTLRFSEPLLSGGAQVVARRKPGGRVSLGPADVDGKQVSASWPADSGGGEFVVAYRVVADDGHPIEGEFGFSIAVPSGSASPGVAPVPGSASPAAAPSDQQEPGGPPWAILGFVAVVAAGAAVVWRMSVR